MNNYPKVALIQQLNRTYIKQDHEIINKYFPTRTVYFRFGKNNLSASIRTIFTLISVILWSDVLFCWFGGTHSYFAVKLAKLFRKKTLVIIGGYEVANVKELDYGLCRIQKGESSVKYIINNADKILAVSDFTKQEILKLCPNRKDIEIVYNAIDCDFFKESIKKENFVVTIGDATEKTFKLKGIHTFVESSRYMKDTSFVVIGNIDKRTVEMLKQINENVIFTGPISKEEVKSILSRAKVYCQLSFRESFGVALAEAMCCNCVPVITKNSAMEEIVGNVGYRVNYNDVKCTVKAIKEALILDNTTNYRSIIISNFSIVERENKLFYILSRLQTKNKIK